MSKIKTIFILFSISCLGQGHNIIPGKFFDEIEFGYSTSVDVLNDYKKEDINELLTRDCPYDDVCSDFYNSVRSLEIKRLGIVFQIDSEEQDDNELIKRIMLYAPFSGKIAGKLSIKLGQTTVADVFEVFPNAEISWTNRKEYWFVKIKHISFLIHRLEGDRDSISSYKDISQRKVHAIMVENDWVVNDVKFTGNCRIPEYAPKLETHRNCYVKKHRGGLHYFIVSDEPTHKNVKTGYWKTFYPSHIIKEEGIYRKGKKKGRFKYYDVNGNLVKEKKHFRFLLW